VGSRLKKTEVCIVRTHSLSSTKNIKKQNLNKFVIKGNNGYYHDWRIVLYIFIYYYITPLITTGHPFLLSFKLKLVTVLQSEYLKHSEMLSRKSVAAPAVITHWE